MKKLAFLFAAVVAVSFASCGPTSEQNASEGQEAEQPTELTESEKPCDEKACAKCDTCKCDTCKCEQPCEEQAAEPTQAPDAR